MFGRRATLYETQKDHWVRCTACSWYCQIPPGAAGICAVRQNQNGQLKLLVYSQAAAIHVDPIEKKPLFHFLPGQKILSLGTLGCNFACDFCQNWDISQTAKKLKFTLIKNNQLSLLGSKINYYGSKASPKELVDYAVRYQIPAIAYTYNEPSIFVEYAHDTAELANTNGLKNVFVSNGYESLETLQYIKPYLDAVNIDLKSFREDFYQKICHSRLAPVLDNIKRVWQMGIWEEVTTLVIPGENDTTEELSQIAHFLATVSPDLPWHVTRFHPDYLMKDKEATPESSLLKAYDIGKKAGLHHVYTGNTLNNEYESTYCPNCQAKLISRNWDQIKILKFKNGTCTNCATKIAGIWH